MNEFLEFFNDKRRDFPMHLDISYSKVCDWEITIRKLGCAKDYPDALCIGNDVMNGIKAFQQECKADKNYELNSVLKYVHNRLDLADDELWVYMDKEE